MISACGFAFADCIRYVTYNLRSFLKMYVTLEIVFWRERMWHEALVREVNAANKIIREYNANLDALREEERLNFIIFEMLCENKTKREARDYDGYSKNFDPLKYDHRGFVSIHKRVREIPLPK